MRARGQLRLPNRLSLPARVRVHRRSADVRLERRVSRVLPVPPVGRPGLEPVADRDRALGPRGQLRPRALAPAARRPDALGRRPGGREPRSGRVLERQHRPSWRSLPHHLYRSAQERCRDPPVRGSALHPEPRHQPRPRPLDQGSLRPACRRPAARTWRERIPRDLLPRPAGVAGRTVVVPAARRLRRRERPAGQPAVALSLGRSARLAVPARAGRERGWSAHASPRLLHCRRQARRVAARLQEGGRAVRSRVLQPLVHRLAGRWPLSAGGRGNAGRRVPALAQDVRGRPRPAAADGG